MPFIDWTFFFTAWELKGRFPAILDHPEYGAAARELYDNAQRAARPDHQREAADRSRRLRLLAGGVGRRRYRCVHRRPAKRRAPALQHAPAAGSRSPTASRTCRWPTSWRTAGRRCATTSARSRSPQASAPRSWRGCSRRGRRLQRDPREGARRPAGRGVRGLPARPVARGLGHQEHGTPDDIIHEKHRGIRPGIRLSGVPGPQREVQAVRPAARRRRGHCAHRSRGDDPGRQRQRPVLRPSRRRATSPSAGSAKTRSSATRGARAARSLKSNAG